VLEHRVADRVQHPHVLIRIHFLTQAVLGPWHGLVRVLSLEGEHSTAEGAWFVDRISGVVRIEKLIASGEKRLMLFFREMGQPV